MTKIRVGLVGCGFVAELHMYAYRRVYGVDVEVSAVAARGDHVTEFARKHQIPASYRSFDEVIADPSIDVVDICTPPNLHASMIVAAMRAGKHVICEKPFAGYFGRDGDHAPIGKHVAKSLMYERVCEEMESTCAAIKSTGKLFMYAEDWIYAPAIAKTAEMLRATRDKILFMKGEESHSGSHAAHAAQWAMTGGGSLIRMGCHPLSAVLYLKQVEARARGESIRPASVTCDVGNVAACLKPDERAFIKANPVDVEDWGTLTVTFSDGTKATVFSGDMIMGGVRNLIETYTSRRLAVRQHHAEQSHDELPDQRGEARQRLHHREGRPQNRLAIRLPRGGMDPRLFAGNPGFHGMRRDRAAAARRSRAGAGDDQGELRRLLGGGRGEAGGVVKQSGRADLLLLALNGHAAAVASCLLLGAKSRRCPGGYRRRL